MGLFLLDTGTQLSPHSKGQLWHHMLWTLSLQAPEICIQEKHIISVTNIWLSVTSWLIMQIVHTGVLACPVILEHAKDKLGRQPSSTMYNAPCSMHQVHSVFNTLPFDFINKC